MAAPTPEKLDELLAEYLRALSAYETAQKAIQAHVKTAFLHLARARTSMGVSQPSLALTSAPLYPQGLIRLDKTETPLSTFTFAIEAVSPPMTSDEETDDQLPISAYIDPIRRYIGLPPPTLRTAQRDFREVATLAVLQLAPARERIRALEVAIRETRARLKAQETGQVNGPIDNVPVD